MRVDFKGRCRGDGKTYVLVRMRIPMEHSVKASSFGGEGSELPCKLLPIRHSYTDDFRDYVLVVFTSKARQRVSFKEIDAHGDVVSTSQKLIMPSASKWASRFNGVFRKEMCRVIRNYDWKGSGRQSVLTFDQFVDKEHSFLLRGSLFTSRKDMSSAFISVFDAHGRQIPCRTVILSDVAARMEDGLESQLRELRFSIELAHPKNGFKENYCFLAGAGKDSDSYCFEVLEPHSLKYLFDEYKNLLCDAYSDSRYGSWMRDRCITGSRERLQKTKHFDYEPLFSIVVPLYKTPINFFEEMAESVFAQTYPRWELILVNASPEESDLVKLVDRYASSDVRVKVVTISENLGITENTNAGIEVCEGDFISFFDHDDVLEPDILFEYASALNRHDDIDLLYCDEDKLYPDGSYRSPMLKPDFSMDLLRDNNYICHMLTVRKSLHQQLEQADKVLDGAQDHNLTLQVAERGKRLYHVPKILYHWRISETSTAANPSSKPYATNAGIEAVQRHLDRLGIAAKVSCSHGRNFRYMVDYETEKESQVSTIILTRGGAALKELMLSLHDTFAHNEYDVVLVSEDRNLPFVQEVLDGLPKAICRITTVSYPGPFNYSQAINAGARQAAGEYLLFLHDDVRIEGPALVRTLMGHCARRDVGASGPMICDFDGTIQQAGLVYVNGEIVPLSKGLYKTMPGYVYRPLSAQNFSALSGICLMTKRVAFESVGGFDEQFGIIYGDIDYCFRLREEGLLIVYTPESIVSHRASMKRGRAADLYAMSGYYHEKAAFFDRWADVLAKGDPYFNKNFSHIPEEASSFKLDYKKAIEL